MTSHGNAKAMQLVEEDFVDRSGFAIGEDHGFADKLDPRFLKLTQDGGGSSGTLADAKLQLMPRPSRSSVQTALIAARHPDAACSQYVGAVPKEFPIAQRRLGVLVDRDHDCLDVVIAPPFMHGDAPDLSEGL